MLHLRHGLMFWQITLGVLIIAFFLLLAALAPLLAPTEVSPAPPLKFAPRPVESTRGVSARMPLPPAPGLPLGTTQGGYDVAYSVVRGVAPALRFGLLTTALTGLWGCILGAVAGYAGGGVSRIILRVADAFLTFPAIAAIFIFRTLWMQLNFPAIPHVVLQAVTLLHLDPTMLALIMFSWVPYTRLMYATVSRLTGTEFVLAARSLGARPTRIVFRHLLPNALSPVIVLAARDIGGMVLLEAAFTFVGMGSGLPWGTLLVAGRDWIVGPGGNPLTYWWVFLPATVALISFSLGWNVLGDGLNAYLKPQERRRTISRWIQRWGN
ncbi:MAG: ABC transporter permease [Anaerolineae bacterium]|nr:ABC transporter permease [Anaerolineae bacterium]